jgi:hypothetical protein
MGRRKSKVCASREEEYYAEAFRTEVDFEQVLYRLALHAQSLFSAAACLGRAQVVLPGGVVGLAMLSSGLSRVFIAVAAKRSVRAHSS